MIRVLQYIGCLQIGGAQSFLMELYRQIDRTRVQFDFVLFPGESYGDFYEEIRRLGGACYEAPRYNGKNHAAFCRWWKELFAAHPEYRILHTHVRGSAGIFLPIAKKYGVVTIAHSHNTSNGHGAKALVKDILQRGIRNSADWLFACSDDAGRWLFGRDVTRRGNYRMIPNGIDTQRFAYDGAVREKLRRELGYGDGDIVLGHVGRMTEQKNHGYLIDRFAEYARRNPHARLLLVGDGETREAVRESCRRQGIEDRVYFAGSRPDPERYLQAMDVFVLPSLWEGLAICAIEAQASGLPCILADTVPREAVLTDSVRQVPLQNPEQWLLAMDAYAGKPRQGLLPRDEEKLAVYDMKKTAAWLQNFYTEQLKKV